MVSHTGLSSEHHRAGGRRRAWNDFLPLFRPFKTQHTCTHTHAHSLPPSKIALSLLVGKELAKEHPGLFREASKNMCFL